MKTKAAPIVALCLQLAFANGLLAQANEVIPTAIGHIYIKKNHLYLEGDQTRTSLTGDQLVGALYNASFDGRYVLFAGAKMENELLLADTSLYTLDLETRAIANVGEAYSIPVVAGAFSPKSYDLAMVDQRGHIYVVRYDQREVRGPINVVAPGEDGGWACVWNQTGRRVAVPKISTDFESPSPRTWGIVIVGGSTISFSEDVQNLCDLPDFTCPEEIHSAPDGSSCPKPTVNNDLVLRLPWPSGTQWTVTQNYCIACSGSADHSGYQVDFGLTPAGQSVNATAAGTLSNSQEFFSNLTPPCPSGNVTTTCGGTSSQLNGTYVKLLHQGSQFQWFSWYLHLTPPLPTKAKTCGAVYSVREPIASSGNTGCSTGPHLHFQMNRMDLPVGDASGFRPTPMRDIEINTTPGVDTWQITYFTQCKTYQAPLASPAPSPIAPANNSTNQSTTPTFSWPSVTGANSYRIVVGTIASALDVLDDPTSAGPSVGSQGVVINTTPTPNNYTPPAALSAGTTYYWRVKGRGSFYGDSSGTFQFTTTGGPSPTPSSTPTNDQCSGAITLSNGVTRTDSTVNATSTGDPGTTTACNPNVDVSKDVWYKFTPGSSGTVTVSTCGSNYDTVLEVYSGTCGARTAIACNDDNGPSCSGNAASVSFSGAAATTYLILAASYGSSGTGGSLQIVASTSSTPTPTPVPTRIIGLSGNLAFGNVAVGSMPQRTLTISNSGNSTLTVSSISYPTGFSGSFSGTVPAGGSHDVTVTFAPTAATNYGGTVTVNSNATSGNNTISASGTGVINPTRIISLSGNLAFGDVAVGSSAQRTLTISNSGNSTLTVSGISYPSGFSGSFSGTIPAGGSHDVTVTFAPGAPGSYGGTVTVASDATSGTNTINASGTGTTTTTRIISLAGNLAFGNVQVGSSAQRTLTISNSGTSTLTVSSISYPSGFSGSFSGTISAGDSHDVTVTFAPGSAGNYGGTVTVNSDATSGTNTIVASGTGTTTPTPTPGGTCPPVITQSSSQTITPGSVSCNNGTGHADNSYWRAFNMGTFTGGQAYNVTSVSFGVESANMTQPVTVRLYMETTGTFPSGTRTQIATSTINLGPAQNGTVFTTPMMVTVPAGTTELIMELNTPDGETAGNLFFVGSNAASQTGPSYISATACGITTPTDVSTIGFPNMHIVFDVNGSCIPGTPTPTPASTRIISLSGNLAFGNVQVGSSAQRTLTINNSGNSMLTVSGISYPSGFSGSFSGTIPAGGSQNVPVTFAPTAATNYGGTVTINSDATTGTNTISASGNGVINPIPVISLSGNLAFGNVAVGSSAQRPLSISNIGNSALTVSSISYPSGFSGSFSGTIPAGGSQDVPVTFAPTAATNYGGTVTVNSDATSGINTIATSGTGTTTSTPTPTCIPGWSAGAVFPAAAVVRAVGNYFPANGRFYTVGGRSVDTPGGDFIHPFEFNPATNTWVTKAATYPDNQINNMACGVLTVGGTPQIYCVGGSAAGATTSTSRVFAYDPVTDVITALTAADNWPGNTPGSILPGGFAVAGNKLYIIGGFQITTNMVAQTWQFDPGAAVGSRWVQRADLPVTRGYIPAVSVDGLILTAGGSITDGTTLTDTTDSFKYDPVANTWTGIANIPRATAETRAVVINNKMWVLGGGRTAPNPSNEVDIYDPFGNTWTTGVPFSAGRRNFAADSDGGSRIWLAGGYDASSVLNSTMEIYGPCGTPTPVFPVQLGNISTRLRVGIGDSAMIGGFIITGAQPKTVIVRGIGPSLPLTGALADPVIEVHGSSGELVASNDNWRDADTKQQIIASGLAPSNDLESALWGIINPGPYTVVVLGKNNATGIGLFDVYDLDRTQDSKLGNISTRGFVETGNTVMIGGTIIVGSIPTSLLVRAIGPSLANLGVPNVLQDPTLELRNGSGTLLASNDNWRDTQEAEIIATGIPPSNDLESAILATLPANNSGYTIIVRGKNNTTGVAVVEAYQLQ